MTIRKSKSCPRCGEPFACAAEAGETCWCAQVRVPPAVLASLRAAYPDCLCPGCLKELAHPPGDDGAASAPTLIERLHAQACAAGSDTYTDPGTGYTVFTAAYLRARGYCCGSGCRHCPYES